MEERAAQATKAAPVVLPVTAMPRRRVHSWTCLSRKLGQHCTKCDNINLASNVYVLYGTVAKVVVQRRRWWYKGGKMMLAAVISATTALLVIDDSDDID